MKLKKEIADKVAKQAIVMPIITTTRLPYIVYYLSLGRLETSIGKESRKIVIANYTKSNHALKL